MTDLSQMFLAVSLISFGGSIIGKSKDSEEIGSYLVFFGMVWLASLAALSAWPFAHPDWIEMIGKLVGWSLTSLTAMILGVSIGEFVRDLLRARSRNHPHP